MAARSCLTGFDRILPCRTVANVLSVGLVVRKCTNAAAKAQDGDAACLVRQPGRSIQTLVQIVAGPPDWV